MMSARHLRWLPLFFAILPTLAVAAPFPEMQRQQVLRHLVKHDCGSCHGMRLEGGLGPALTAKRLEPFTVPQLAVTILHGRPGTPMPPWNPFISEPEAHWIAQQLKQDGFRD